jgi:tyrosyl-DNA phosphodiesterase 2
MALSHGAAMPQPRGLLARCRAFVKLKDWRLQSVQLVGTQAIPGVTYVQELRTGRSRQLPVLPSDHFGLLVRLQPAT